MELISCSERFVLLGPGSVSTGCGADFLLLSATLTAGSTQWVDHRLPTHRDQTPETPAGNRTIPLRKEANSVLPASCWTAHRTNTQGLLLLALSE
jgi:hypothetical protein